MRTKMRDDTGGMVEIYYVDACIRVRGRERERESDVLVCGYVLSPILA